MIPGHGRDTDGMLTVGGMRVDALAERFGTPALLFDTGVLDTALRAVLEPAARFGIRVSYAAKAFMVVALARRLRAEPIGLDVVSLGELITAERAGIEPVRITLHGAGKTNEEIETLFAGRIARIAVDSLDELRRIIKQSRGRPGALLLRLNTGIEAHTHEFVRTAGDDSKFGLAPHEEAQALALLRDAPHLRLLGVHAHIGSQVFDAAPYEANVQMLCAALERIRAASFPDAGTIVTGGGFGVQMHPESADESIDLTAILRAASLAARDGIRLEIEPGRAISGAAGTSLYRVMAIKRYAKRTFVIVDGSMADNPRPALYGAYHHVVAARTSNAGDRPVTVCGRSCENDELADAALPADLEAGDLIAFCTTGAYTYAMASNYNRFPRPPVIAIEDRTAHVWADRESYASVLSNDV